MSTLLTIFILFSSLLTVNATCGDIPISTTTAYDCYASRQITQASLPNMPTGGKKIYVQGEYQLVDRCSVFGLYRIFTLVIEPSPATYIKLMDAYWDGSTTFSFGTEDTGVRTVYQETMNEAQYSTQWYTFTLWVNIAKDEASAFFNYYGQGSITIPETPSYDSSWTIDMTPRLFLCSDSFETDNTECNIANLKVWYQGPYYNPPIDFSPQIRDGVMSKLIAEYRLIQNTGYVITDYSLNQLGPGYFGTSTSGSEDPDSTQKPSWIPEFDSTSGKPMQYAGLEFDQSTEFVTLPTFEVAKSLNTGAYSFTLKLWLKLYSTPTAGDAPYIFRYLSFGTGDDLYALKVQSDRKIQMIHYDQSAFSTSELSDTAWNSIIVTFTYMEYATAPSSPDYSTYISIMINNNDGDFSGVLHPKTQYPYDSMDTVTIGGPPTVLGIISGLEIYSPGTNFISAATSCTPSVCSRDLGISSPSTCVLHVCTANCDACFDSTETGCLKCSINYGLYQSKCVLLSCPTAQFLDSTYTCQNCIDHCDVCPDSTTCTTCKTGFINEGGVCSCPSNYQLEGSTCTYKSICGSLNFYYPNDDTCKSTCKYPYKIVTESSGQYCILDIDEGDAEQAQQVAKISSAASDAANIGGMLITMLTSSNPTLLLTGSLTEMLQYIQYLRIDYPPKVHLMLEEQDVSSGGLTIITEIPDKVAQAIPNQPLPEEFAKNDTDSSFIANTWDLLITLSAITLSICLILILKPCIRDFSRINSFMDQLLHSLKWNLFLGVFCSSYGFAGMYTALEFRTVNMSAALSILSFIVSLIINTLGFFVFYLMVQLGVTFQTIKKGVRDPQERARQIEEAEEKWSSCEVLFGEYKIDYISQKLYLFIFMLRTYLHYAVLGYLNDYPFFQTCLFTLLSVAMILYLIIRRPIKSRMNFIQQFVCELTILLVNVCVLILAIMEKWNIVDDDTRVGVGDAIITANLLLSFTSLAFLAIELLREFYKIVKKWRQGRKNLKKLDMITTKTGKAYKTKKPRQNFPSDHNENELEISNLDVNNESSIVQLRPQ